jgi:hypothetical protein
MTGLCGDPEFRIREQMIACGCHCLAVANSHGGYSFEFCVKVRPSFLLGQVGGRIGDKQTSDTAKRQIPTVRHTNPGTEAEPQQIVAQRLLSCLQYHVP